MFRITSSGSLVQYLAKNYKNGSIVSVDMDKVGVVAAYCDRLCVCVCVCMQVTVYEGIYIYTVNCTHTHIGSQYATITPTLSMQRPR